MEVAATERLEAAIEAGTFRSDLFYRLNVFPIAVPPLRERPDDIPLLLEYFIDRYTRKSGKTIRRVNMRTLDHLRSYPWPGNVRELQNVIERSVILCETDEFTVDQSWLPAPALDRRIALSGTLAAHERSSGASRQAGTSDRCGHLLNSGRRWIEDPALGSTGPLSRATGQNRGRLPS